MFNTSRQDHVRNGFELGHQLDAAIRRLNRKPIPKHWHADLRSQGSIKAIVTAIAKFDSTSDRLVHLLADTPVGDADVTTVMTAGLLPGVIQRNRCQPHRIADTITELSLYLASRPQFNPERWAALVCLDVAEQNVRREVTRQHQYDEFNTDLPSGIDFAYPLDIEAAVLTHINVATISGAFNSVNPNADLATVLDLAQRQSLNQNERQHLPRNRRQRRPVVAALLEVA